ncbi:glycerophosphodiester phosphodiesterase [Mariniluteicoccus endophyticus]
MTKIWAHRGASAYAPENTIEAFLLAAEQGAHGVELDVQLSADGELVVVHDETIDRTSDGTGTVAAMTLAELRGHDYANGMDGFSGVALPTLAEVFEALRPTGLSVNVELKNGINFYPGIEKATLAAIEASGMRERVLVSSFNHYSLKTLQQLDRDVPLGLLFAEGLYLPWEYAADFGAAAIHPCLPFLQVRGVVEYAHQAGVAVNVWTVDEREHLELCVALGVDAIITNRPDDALAALG